MLQLMFVFSVTSLLVYFSGVYVFSSNTNIYLWFFWDWNILLFLYFFWLLFIYIDFIMIIFLVFSVCEGALGLSILVSVIRVHGNDFSNFFWFMLKYLFILVFMTPLCLISNF